jgi:7,8-dihydroneopterin aldolase/epimerase/oxygenase
MTHVIEVSGIRLYANHGCLEEEELIGGQYTVDVYLKTDFTEAAEQDELSKTIDYVTVNRIVEEEMAIRSKLIEHVGQRIITRLKHTFQLLLEVRVTVTKHSPPINGDVDRVSITISA